MSLYTSVRTELGTIAIGYNDRGISRVVFPSADWNDLSAGDLTRVGLKTESTPPAAIAAVARGLQAHIRGDVQDFSGAPLDTEGASPFLLRVQRAAQTIPAGQTRSYGELAESVGAPKASRAAGRAMSTNPWPIIVPCHRVLGRSGFGDYSAGSGLHTKFRLLWREGYRGRTSNVSFDERAAVEQLRKADARLGRLIDRVGPFTMQAAAPSPRAGIAPFTSLAKAIISQQLSGKAAATIYARVARLWDGDTVDNPQAVMDAPKAELRAAGLSENKALSLRDLAKHALDGILPSRAEMEALSDEEVIERLVHIRGIGRWSVQMLLMFYLGRPNVLPVADLGVQKGFALTYGMRSLPSAKAMERTARAWAPFASVASWYMWRAVEVNRYKA
jgi:methylated-DNA-[protein]-cysteine S-methyltransferase